MCKLQSDSWRIARKTRFRWMSGCCEICGEKLNWKLTRCNHLDGRRHKETFFHSAWMCEIRCQECEEKTHADPRYEKGRVPFNDVTRAQHIRDQYVVLGIMDTEGRVPGHGNRECCPLRALELYIRWKLVYPAIRTPSSQERRGKDRSLKHSPKTISSTRCQNESDKRVAPSKGWFRRKNRRQAS